MAFSSMYVGATGLTAQSQNMSVIGNNIANVNTIGFKESRTVFADLFSTNAAGGSQSVGGVVDPAGQIGKGVRVADVQTLFTQGSFEDGTTTDLAIGGEGFFGVRNADTGEVAYTRAGNFTFDKNGYYVTSAGMRVQGHAYNPKTETYSSEISSIQLPYEETMVDGELVKVYTSPPKATGGVDLNVNLDAGQISLSNDQENPYFSMVSEYDGQGTPPISNSSVAYSTNLTVYDEDGNAHEMNVSFDPVTTSNASGGYRTWEYMVTVPAAEDGRANVQGTSGAGLVMCGTLTFDAGGTIMSQSAYTLDETATDTKNLSNWSAASISENGVPQFTTSFLNEEGTTSGPQTIELDFGIKSTTGEWTSASNAGSAGSVGTDGSMLVSMGNDFKRDANASTSYNEASASMSRSQDGYAKGYLNDLEVNSDGEMIGVYSNGQDVPFYKLSMYNFKNEFGLRSEGGNLYTATTASGNAIAGNANEDGLGSVVQSNLESSNVDLTTQFTDLIQTQRGFQANSKIITTSDSIITTLTQIKR